MSDQLNAALIRSLITSFLSAIATGVATYGAGATQEQIIATAITAFITPLVTRGGIEGVYDANRDKNGQVNAADVGSKANTAQIAAKANAADDFEGDVIPVQRELWAEVGSEIVQVVGIRTNRKTKKIDYLIQPNAGGAPDFAERVDRTLNKPPSRP
jgi:hypothetical protein